VTVVNHTAKHTFTSAPASGVDKRVLKVGVIGYGYWGPKLVRNFQEHPLTRVTMVADRDTSRLNQVGENYPTIVLTTDHRELLASDVDAVVVATPVMTHYPLALECLQHNKHVLVEKPLARTSEQTATLIAEANQRGLVLMVGHTFECGDAQEPGTEWRSWPDLLH
jgi:predicted dehydrogenase